MTNCVLKKFKAITIILLSNKRDTFKYHVFAPTGSLLELIYLYFLPSFHLIYVCFCPVGLSLLGPGDTSNFNINKTC